MAPYSQVDTQQQVTHAQFSRGPGGGEHGGDISLGDLDEAHIKLRSHSHSGMAF